MNKPASPPPTRSANKPKALGRGLDTLLARPVARTAAAAPAAAADGTMRHVATDQIIPSPYQPRRDFDQAELEGLAASIRIHGIVQPLTVRPGDGGGFELVAGERRLRAAQLAGLTEVPVVVRTFGDAASLEVAIIENLQRADLNPVEQAEAFRELAQQFSLTQEAIAEKTGKDRATIANFLRLLRLEADVIALIRERKLSPGQARPLLALAPEAQRALARQVVDEAWPARRVEQHVARLQQPSEPAKPAPPRDPNERDAELQLARSLGTRVELKSGRRGRGAIVINYASLDEFQRLFERLTHA